MLTVCGKKWIGLLGWLLVSMPLTAGELAHIEPLSGTQENLLIDTVSRQNPYSEMSAWLIDAIRYQRLTRLDVVGGYRLNSQDVVYIPSRRWIEFSSIFKTDWFKKKIYDDIEPVRKGEHLFQEALKTSGKAEKIRSDGWLVFTMPADYDSLKDKPSLTELFLPAVAAMAHGYSSRQADRCGQEYGCQVTVHFIPGSLEPESIDIDFESAPLPGASFHTSNPVSQEAVQHGKDEK